MPRLWHCASNPSLFAVLHYYLRFRLGSDSNPGLAPPATGLHGLVERRGWALSFVGW
jgi:hypothetical protein